MANEASILNNPTSIPEAVSTGYQRQNVNIVAARVGMDESVVVGGAGKCTLKVSGPIDVNGVLYTIDSEVEFSLDTAGEYIIYLEDSIAGHLTPKITSQPGLFVADKNAHYTADGYRILNWLIQYDGTTAIAYKVGRDRFETVITASGQWRCMFSQPYEITMCGKGGNGGDAVNLYLGGNGGGALTGHKKLYIEASDTWTAVFSAASGGMCSFANIANTLQAQNGYNGVTDGYQTPTACGSAHAGFDRVVAGEYGYINGSNGAAFRGGGDSELGIGGENGYILNSITGGNGKGYGAGGGAGRLAYGDNGIGGTGAPAVIIIRG
jgi:hypothetical protein